MRQCSLAADSYCRLKSISRAINPKSLHTQKGVPMRNLVLLFLAVAFWSFEIHADYCTAGGQSTFEYIKQVKVNGLVSDSTSNGGYKLFSSPVFSMTAGANSVTLAPGFSSGAYSENFAVFIDLNHDGIWSADERLFSGTTNYSLTGTVTIPASALGGPTRMRVAMSYGSQAPSCGQVSYGEFEDYTVDLAMPSNPQPQPPPLDQLITFENLFGGSTIGAGPTISLGSGVTATTTAPYFYYFSGAPFSSGYLKFINLKLGFPAPVQKLTFQAAGSCTNCSQTVTVKADGNVIGSFVLNYNVVSNIVLTLPIPATAVEFNQNFSIDNLAIDYL